jgi:hypothetical protein
MHAGILIAILFATSLLVDPKVGRGAMPQKVFQERELDAIEKADPSRSIFT